MTIVHFIKYGCADIFGFLKGNLDNKFFASFQDISLLFTGVWHAFTSHFSVAMRLNSYFWVA